MEFEYANNMCVHQTDTGLPFRAQTRCASLVPVCDLQRNRRAGQTIFSEPGMCLTVAPQPANERVSVGQLRALFEFEHLRGLLIPLVPAPVPEYPLLRSGKSLCQHRRFL